MAAVQSNTLEMETWHTCETSHCRAGWVVHLAGKEGCDLERFHNTELAARLIYQASGYEITPSKFYASNEDAMKDIERCAEESK